MLVYLMIGGVASLSGPLVGTILIVGLMQALTVFQEYTMVILGPILVLVIIFFPDGIAGQANALVRLLSRRRGET
jgi:branched-chain amino acid transport system permease protein